VITLLIALPLLSAVLLARWLDTPRENYSPEEVFARLELPPVPTTSLHSLAYGNLLFVRLQVDDSARKALLRSLSSYEVSRGEAEKPISLELEREWWSPPRQQPGTRWTRGEVTVWNADHQADFFYAVVFLSRQAGATSP
jgi:hypothetical protein